MARIALIGVVTTLLTWTFIFGVLASFSRASFGTWRWWTQ